MRTFLASLIVLLVMTTGCQGPVGKWRVPSDQSGVSPTAMRMIEHRVRVEAHRGEIAAASIAIHHRGQLVYQENFGRVPHDGGKVPVDGYTLFDLASLTKPLAGARLAHDYLVSGVLDGETAALVEAIVQSRTGLDDEELLPYVSSLLNNPDMSLLQRHILMRAWKERLQQGLLEGEGASWRYSNYAWGFLSLLPLAEPGLAPILNRRMASLDQPQLTFRPREDEVVAPSAFGVRGGEFHQGRAYDPLADFLATRLSIPPVHSGLFGTSIGVGSTVSRWLDPSHARPAFSSWFFTEATPLPAADHPSEVIRQTRGGMRIATGNPWAPSNTRSARYLYQDGYTGTLLWVDRHSRTVLVILTNASLDNSQDAFRVFARDMVNILYRGINEAVW